MIFPLGEAERHLWTAAWDGYLGRQPDLDMCDVLDGSYQMAVDSLDPDGDDRAELARATSPGLHLITRYWHGRLTFDSHGQLLRRYYRNAPAAARVHLMHVLGRELPAGYPRPRRPAHPLVGGAAPGRARGRRSCRTGGLRGMVRGREAR